MNKGKETYQNIPLPDGLSNAVSDGLKRGRRRMYRKWYTGIGSLAAACVVAGVALFVFSGDGIRTPGQDNASGNTPSTARIVPEPEADPGQTPMTIPAVSDNEVGPVDSADPDVSAETPEYTQPSSIKVYGTVSEITDGQILLEDADGMSPYPSILLNLSENTYILGATDFAEKALADLNVGDYLIAYVSPMMTRSIPPMSNAALIFCDIPQDTGAPEYAQITDVYADDEGNMQITTDRDLVLNVTEDTVVQLFGSDETLTTGGLQIGDSILIRYSFMTMSIPAQTNPEAIVLMPQNQDSMIGDMQPEIIAPAEGETAPPIDQPASPQ